MDRDEQIQSIIIDFLEFTKQRGKEEIFSRPKKDDILINSKKVNKFMRQGEKLPFSEDLKYMKLLYGDIAKELDPYVKAVVDEFDYEGSPIYNEYIDRHTVGQMVYLVLNRGQEMIYQVEEIYLSDDFSVWGERNLLRQLIQTMVLNEIYTTKRHDIMEYNDNDINRKTNKVKDTDKVEHSTNVDEVYFGKKYKLENYL